MTGNGFHLKREQNVVRMSKNLGSFPLWKVCETGKNKEEVVWKLGK
jgi:hypothetical protein